MGNALAQNNIDPQVVSDFGEEWAAYDQDGLGEEATQKAFDQYFHIFPFDQLPANAQGFDMGCGSGRWAKLVAPRVGVLHCIDPSAQALAVAQKKLQAQDNVRFYESSVDATPLNENTQDFGYCLGVLHHIPDTLSGIKDCTRFLKSGAPFLLYLYYNFENRPLWFKILWKISDLFRRVICAMPFKLKKIVCAAIAVVIYVPLARLALFAEKMGKEVANFPLADYRNKPFYFLRTDALDRFGTRLEKRFSKAQITNMLEQAGMENVSFSDQTPHWVCVSYKK